MFNPDRDLDNAFDPQEDASAFDSPDGAAVAAHPLELFNEEFHAYRDGSAIANTRGCTKRQLLDRVDKIDKALVARVDVNHLFGAVHSSYWCSAAFIPTLLYAMPDGWFFHGRKNGKPFKYEAASPSLWKNEEEKKRYRTKKRMSSPTAKNITSLVSAALRSLATESHLFERPPGHGFVETEVGAFFVEKSGDANSLRVIVDGRYANLYFDRSESKFSFFSLEILRQVIENLSVHNKWYAVNFDLRHWFHEIALPERFQKLFGLPLTDRGNQRDPKDRSKNYHLVPRAFPMGWSFSPIVAQTITWSLVLSQKPGARHKMEADLDLKSLEAHTGLFSWVPLKSGGGIFVLLDNILVVSPKKEVAQYWFDKIYYDTKEYNAVLKSKDIPGKPNASEYDKLHYHSFVELSKDGCSNFEFLGVIWTHHERRLAFKQEEDRELPNASVGRNNVVNESDAEGNFVQVWSGTYRELASILGRVNWHRRVHGLHPFDDPEDRIGSQTLRRLYTLMTPPAGKTWNDSLKLGASSTAGLIRAWKFRCGNAPVVAVPLHWNPNENMVRWFATDAAKSAMSHLAVVVEYEIQNWASRLFSESAAVPKSVTVSSYPSDHDIALGELFAIRNAVSSVTVDHTLVVLATDSMNAKRWIEAMKANNEQALVYLREIFLHMKKYNLRLYLVYVPSKQNAADHATRPHVTRDTSLFDQSTVDATRKYLERAEVEAKRMWFLTGGMERETNVDLE